MDTMDYLIDDFTDQRFKTAFHAYFDELGEQVKNWDALFLKMNNDPHGKDYAYLRMSEDGHIIGFIQFTEIELSSWFFKARLGFIREFWVDKAFRSQNHGSELLALAEDYFRQQNLFASILTTDTAERFYKKRGYIRADGIIPDNDGTVLVKLLKSGPLYPTIS